MAHTLPAIDGWSLAHIAVGVGLSVFRVPRPAAYAIIILTEVVELAARRSGVDFFRESEQNVVADLALSIGSYELKRFVRGST